MLRDALQLLNHIAQIIYDKKGKNILALDLSRCSSMANYFLIAEGLIERHVSSIAQAIIESCDSYPMHVEGLKEGDWIVLDFSLVMIHLFRPGLREKYSLEKLWKESSLIDLDIKT
jgi:ribosome-associated protein